MANILQNLYTILMRLELLIMAENICNCKTELDNLVILR